MSGSAEPQPGTKDQGRGTARAFLTDLGLAKSVATGSKLTRTGQALGTPAYMSPEQARGEVSSLTPATDVWSLGGVLYEMLGGRPPFEGETDAAVVGGVLLEEPPALGRLREDLPRGLDRIVRACLAKDARRRFLGAGALRDDLDRLLRGEHPRARVPGAWRWKVGAGALAAAAAGTALALSQRVPNAPSAPRVPAQTSHADPPAVSPAERLAAKARALRQSDPRRAAEILRESLDLEPA
ncbi:MAG: protein kinase, partial [Planctomycetales bacterium]|nr:protein kinase [Planctomycetales bacterium]